MSVASFQFDHSGAAAYDLTEYVKNTDDDVILIPQSLTDDVKIVLDYDITTAGGNKINQVSDIKLNAYTPSWGIGTRYTYNITIGMEEIIFDPAVTKWTDATPETNIAI